MDLTAILNDLLTRTNGILAEDAYNDFLLERVYHIKTELLEPAITAVKERPDGETAARELRALFSAMEEYTVILATQPDQRDEYRKKVEALKAVVRRRLLTGDDNESDIELLLDEIRKWQWKTTLDDRGRIVYATAKGKEIPASSVIAEKAGPAVIDQAVQALKPYSERMRPMDVRGNPGGLVVVEDCRRAIIVGDLHGRYDNLQHILRDKNNLEDILAGKAHLVFTGDAVHPRSSAMNEASAYEDSFCVMLLIMTLKAENPFNVHYLIGNHDFAHVGGRAASRGEVRQDVYFARYIKHAFGRTVFKRYRQFVAACPVALKMKAVNGYALMAHAGLSPHILNEQGLINIFVKGPHGRELTDMLWSRNYRDRAMLADCLERVGGKLIVVGHTPPTRRRAERYGLEMIAEKVFAHVHHLQVIVNAQNNVFGYLDMDLTRPLPDDVTDLCAPDGRPAYRMLRPGRTGNPAPAREASASA